MCWLGWRSGGDRQQRNFLAALTPMIQAELRSGSTSTPASVCSRHEPTDRAILLTVSRCLSERRCSTSLRECNARYGGGPANWIARKQPRFLSASPGLLGRGVVTPCLPAPVRTPRRVHPAWLTECPSRPGTMRVTLAERREWCDTSPYRRTPPNRPDTPPTAREFPNLPDHKLRTTDYTAYTDEANRIRDNMQCACDQCIVLLRHED